MAINISSNFIIERDEVYTSNSGPAFEAYGLSSIEFTNYGTIRATGAGAMGFYSYVSSGSLHNAGLIEVQGTETAYGFYSPQWMAAIKNSGQITVSGTTAYGVYTWSPGQVFDNSGTLTVTATGNATGMYLVNGGKVSNTGLVTVQGGTSAAGVYIDRFEGYTFENKGDIIVSASSGQSFGLVVSGLAQAVTAPNIINRGVITADVAIYGRDGGYSPSQPTIENIANYGVVNGYVILGAGADVLRNYNVINGDVDMGTGADFVALTGGWITGIVDLGEDDDTALGSAGSDVFFGYLGRDTIRGAGGDDLIDGEQGNDALFGGDGDDEIYGGSGSDAISGDNGDDAIEGGTGDDIIDGGSGADTAFYAGAFSDFTITTVNGVTTVTSSATGSDTLRNVEWLQFADRLVQLSDAAPAIVGTAADEILRGTASAETLYGLGGNDALYGEAGDDRLEGGDGDDRLEGAAGDDILDGGAGYDTAVISALRTAATVSYVGTSVVVVSAGGRDTLTNVEAVSFSDGVYDIVNGALSAQSRQTVTGTAGTDVLKGAGSNDILTGLAGKDTLTGGGGSDVLDGGEGVDTAVYGGARRQYAASHTAVSGGPEGGTDTLVSVETLKFLDGSITYDENSVAAEILRIYDATLDRGPDAFGLDGWLQARAAGTTLAQMANSFVNSDEFKARYGALDDDAFVSLLYNFCLDRNVDPLGLKSYTDLLKSGAWSRGDVVLSLSESVEHRQLTAPQLAQGLWVADQTTLIIARLYDATFDRLPDLFGLDAWRQEIAAGRSLNSMAAAFASSVEFQDRYGALNNADFVKLIYTYSLDRNVDPLGLKSYTDLLDSGQWSRADVLLSLSESTEHKQLTAPLWYNGVHYQGYLASSAAAEPAEKVGAPLTLQARDIDPAVARSGPMEANLDRAFFIEGGSPVMLDHAADTFVMPAAFDGGAFRSPDGITFEPFGTEEPVLNIPADPVDQGFDLPVTSDPILVEGLPMWIKAHHIDPWV